MAHQTHNIPWSAISDTLELVKTHPHRNNFTDERVRVLAATHDIAAEKQRAHFARVFVKNLADFAATERRKYPADLLADAEGSHDDPVVFAETTEAALEAHLRDGFRTLDDISPDRGIRHATTWVTADNGYADSKARVVMALIATGETLSLLRLARWREDGAKGSSPLMRYWSYPGANPGWSNVMRSALQAYLFFNVVVCWEQLWMVYEDGDGSGGKPGVVVRGKARAPGRDYRDSHAFAYVLSDCTRSQDGDTWTVPHRVFYGGEFGYDLCEQLKAQGLDPLHPAKMEQMREYLKMCWEHLVRVHMVLAEADTEFDWEFEVKSTIRWLWGHQAFPNLYN